MRIIAGTLKKRTLKEVPHESTRSTRDRVKENFFNMLPNLREEIVLDLFAGSGALGFEALSRGAKSCTFVETNKVAFNVLRENMMHLGLEGASTLHKEDAIRFLKKMNSPFDLIVLDPPYNQGLINQVLPIIKAGRLLEKDGLIALLHSHEETPEIPCAFTITKQRTYGITTLTFLEWS